MGVDADQDWMKPGLVIGSGMKRIDQAVVHVCQLVRENQFKATVQSTGGILTLGMAEGASGISNPDITLDDAIQFAVAHEQLTGESVLPATPENIKATVKAMREAQPAWVWEGLSELENKIRAGTIVVPSVSDHDTAENYRALWA
jgi:basic membrane protein A